MRWFPVKLMVLLLEVVIDLYILMSVGFFSRNALTSLNVILPLDKTEMKNINSSYGSF